MASRGWGARGLGGPALRETAQKPAQPSKEAGGEATPKEPLRHASNKLAAPVKLAWGCKVVTASRESLEHRYTHQLIDAQGKLMFKKMLIVTVMLMVVKSVLLLALHGGLGQTWESS